MFFYEGCHRMDGVKMTNLLPVEDWWNTLTLKFFQKSNGFKSIHVKGPTFGLDLCGDHVNMTRTTEPQDKRLTITSF